MARFMLSPSIEDFLELADAHGHPLEISEVDVGGQSPYIGQQLDCVEFRDRGVIVIGIRRASGEHLMPPPANTEILAEDRLIVFGRVDAINTLIGVN
jgi:voltage-gated potassium channel